MRNNTNKLLNMYIYNIEKNDPLLSSLEKGFKTQIPNGNLFGALKPVEFEREFQLKLGNLFSYILIIYLIFNRLIDFIELCIYIIYICIY